MAGSTTRRRGWRLFKIVAIVFVVFHLGAGWYFGTLIRSDAMEVKPFDDPEFTVAAVGAGLVTLDGTDAGEDGLEDLGSDELMGVDFGRGYGRLGEVTDTKGDVVTRSYTHLSGDLPVVGLTATLHAVAYPQIPGVDDLPVWVEVSFASEFGEFPAWLVDRGSDTWAITLHGRGAERDEALRMLPTLDAAGLSTLMISYRNDPDAPKTGDRLARFGVTEWEDLEGAVAYAVDNGAKHVVLVGFSMGGAIAMAFMERSPLAERVSAVILEAPAIDLGWMVSARAAETDLIPGLPIKVPPTLTPVAKTFASIQYDASWWLMNYLSRPGSIEVRTLIIHGGADDTVPVGISEKLATQLGTFATFEVFPDANHVRAWNVDRTRYEQAVADFLADVLG